MRTHSPKSSDIARKWHIFDAKDQVLGRLATQIANILMGKGKVDFVRHFDMGDHVVVINASEIIVTGQKAQQKIYRHHSGFPGGMKETSYEYMLQAHPDRIIVAAVRGMLPNNKLRDRMLKHLHVYADANHPYVEQFKSK